MKCCLAWKRRKYGYHVAKVRRSGLNTIQADTYFWSCKSWLDLLFYLVGFRFVIQKGWITFERVWCWFLRYFVHTFISFSPYTVEYTLTLIRFCTLWEGPLIIFFNFIIINIYSVSEKKRSWLDLLSIGSKPVHMTHQNHILKEHHYWIADMFSRI